MERGFFGSLLDLSFTSFVTTKLIKVLYVLSLVLLALLYVVVAIALFTSGGGESVSFGDDGTLQTSGGGSAGLGLLWLFIIGPLLVFFYTLAYRVVFELVIVLFRIYENSRDLLAVTRAGMSAPGGGNGGGTVAGEAPPTPPATPPAPAG